MIKTLLDVLTMSVVDLTGQLKEAEEAFEEAPTSLQQDGKLYLTEEAFEEEARGREPLRQQRKRRWHWQRSWARSRLWAR
jgi:hypothetical protein